MRESASVRGDGPRAARPSSEPCSHSRAHPVVYAVRARLRASRERILSLVRIRSCSWGSWGMVKATPTRWRARARAFRPDYGCSLCGESPVYICTLHGLGWVPQSAGSRSSPCSRKVLMTAAWHIVHACVRLCVRVQSEKDLKSRMANLLGDITLLRGLFFEGLRKSSEEKVQRCTLVMRSISDISERMGHDGSARGYSSATFGPVREIQSERATVRRHCRLNQHLQRTLQLVCCCVAVCLCACVDVYHHKSACCSCLTHY